MSSKRIDWSQLWYPGPRRAYTADEMARAGSDAPSPTLVAVAAVNFAAVAFVVLQLAPAAHTARLTAALAALAALGSVAARWLWWRPWRRPLMQAQLGVVLVMLVLALGMRWRLPGRAERAEMATLALVLVIGASLLVAVLWFLVVWRSQQIEARLREQAERSRAIEMARRLAAAQIEPHFLFNTLASVQHWVQTKDDRAAPLLAALTGYLRATLPLFHRALLPAGDELVAVQRYLEVMQARLGQRLAWRLDVAPGLATAMLPPGLLLTLVENAVAHGVEPRLADGQIVLRAWRDGADAVFEVVDNGPGPRVGMQEGVGLSNARQRLALSCGDSARLQLSAAAGGGCRAEIRLPFMPSDSAST